MRFSALFALLALAATGLVPANAKTRTPKSDNAAYEAKMRKARKFKPPRAPKKVKKVRKQEPARYGTPKRGRRR